MRDPAAQSPMRELSNPDKREKRVTLLHTQFHSLPMAGHHSPFVHQHFPGRTPSDEVITTHWINGSQPIAQGLFTSDATFRQCDSSLLPEQWFMVPETDVLYPL